MQVNIKDIGGSIVKEDDRYIVKDNTSLKNLVVSSTDLKPNKQTSGHAHSGQEEVYIFVEGTGVMELIDTNGKTTKHDVGPGSVILIEDGYFHRVYSGDKGCYFVCVFDGNRNH
tara:strand:+ start:1437 stop:1778 length:342 start_codon:yes stop_codon:yes gene_type:complete